MVRVNRRFANNLAVNFNYTWSHVMDMVTTTPMSSTTPSASVAATHAGYDQPNVVSLDFVYTLPKVKGALDQPSPPASLATVGNSAA